jgi:segregation and condensation protein B
LQAGHPGEDQDAQPDGAEDQAAAPSSPEAGVEGKLFEDAGADKGEAALDAKKADRIRNARVRDRLQLILDELIAAYADGQRGMEIREVAGGYRMTTKPEYHDAVRSFVKGLKPPMKLSLQALETLAVVAYKQPVTAPEVSEIRGVDSGGVLGSLIGRKLVTTAGRKHVIGRPILYKTTKEFLLRFGLKDINELPSMEEFEKMAGELAEAEAEAEDAAMRSEDAPSQPAFEEETGDAELGVDEADSEDRQIDKSVPEETPVPAASELPQIKSEPITPIPGDDLDEGGAHEDAPDLGKESVTSLGIEPSPSLGEKADLPGEDPNDPKPS